MIFKNKKQQETRKSYDKIVTEHALKKAVKDSIKDQHNLSKKADKLRTQAASR